MRTRLLAAIFLLLIFTSRGVIASDVLAEICEQGLADADAWPKLSPAAAETFSLPAFACDLLPQKYVGDGVRGERPSPSLLRLTGESALPPGNYRVLIRSRSAARLWFDNKLVAETPFAPKNGGDGSQHDTEKLTAIDLGPGFRFAPMGEYEHIRECEIASNPVNVRMEIFVGGREGKKPRRVEMGETVVAVQAAGSSTWHLLAPQGLGPAYTDAQWKIYQTGTHAAVKSREMAARAARRASNAPRWQQRREDAARWLANTAAVAVPPLPTGFTAQSPVDHFLADRFIAVKTLQEKREQGTVDFFRDIQPLLEARCVECHRGQKAKGGLRLDDAEKAMLGGDSGPAILPGKGDSSEIMHRILSKDADEVMPPKGKPLNANEATLLRRWLDEGAVWPELSLTRATFAATADDYAFLRRVYLDVIGVPPTADEITAFVADTSAEKREQVVDRLLADVRWADAWMPFWQDLLAENPNILNPTLNNTGPFRWWLHEAMLDDLPLDRMVTQLMEQDGSTHTGGPAGFRVASQNDAPFATKAVIVSSAFMGVDMKCARCHDSPAGSAKQEQLFQLGAMLAEKPLDVPITSSVDPAKLHAGGRKALIEVTLKPGTKVAPSWPFASVGLKEPQTVPLRSTLANLLTSPQNERFAQVMVNRLWARFMGRGLVEPQDDWEKGKPTHPELLRWLARELVRAGYQLKPVARLILTSAAYQRATDASLRQPDPLYTAPEPRRLLAETVLDSLVASTGKDLKLEPLCLDLNGRREQDNALDLRVPQRAWMLASLSNERDRPSLTLPRLQAVTDLLAALGWRGTRQDANSTRDTSPNALPPAILAHGTLSTWLTRLSDDHPFTMLAIRAESVDSLIIQLFLHLLARPPTAAELARHRLHIAPGFSTRLVAHASAHAEPHKAPSLVTWTNHLLPEANAAKQALASEAQRGDPPTRKLETDWQRRCEDVIWSLINAPELLYRP